jgi:hypothetical protein
MNLTTKVQPKSVPAKVDVAKQIQAEAEIGCQMLESIYEPICYSEAVAPAMNNVRMARSVIKDITTCMESLEANGYSDVWMDTVNADGNFMNFLNLTPADLIGSEAHKKDVCMQSLMDSLKDWAVKLWDFIVRAYEGIMAFLKRVGFVTAKDVEDVKQSWSFIGINGAFNYMASKAGYDAKEAAKFYAELPSLAALNSRLEIIKSIAVALSGASVTNMIDGLGVKPIDLINTAVVSKYANIKHGMIVDFANGVVSFEPFVLTGIDFTKWIKDNKDINIAHIGLMNNLRKDSGCLDYTERLVNAAYSQAKTAAAAAKKAGDTTKLSFESTRCARAQALLNIINVLVTQISVINNFGQLYKSKLQDVALWIQKQQQKQPKP